MTHHGEENCTMSASSFSYMWGVDPEESVTGPPLAFTSLAAREADKSAASLSVYHWNFNIDEAPRGRHFTVTRVIKGVDRNYDEFEPQWLWLATKCGKVLKSYWMPPEGKTRPVGRWLSLDVNEQPVAWQAFVVPAHPGFEAPVRCDRPAVSEQNPKAAEVGE